MSIAAKRIGRQLPSSLVSAGPEATLLNLILIECRRLGIMAFHHYGGKVSECGFPDLVISGWTDGGLLLAELKTDDGTLSAAQMNWARSLSITSHYVVWQPRDWRSGNIQTELAALIPQRHLRAA